MREGGGDSLHRIPPTTPSTPFCQVRLPEKAFPAQDLWAAAPPVMPPYSGGSAPPAFSGPAPPFPPKDRRRHLVPIRLLRFTFCFSLSQSSFLVCFQEVTCPCFPRRSQLLTLCTHSRVQRFTSPRKLSRGGVMESCQGLLSDRSCHLPRLSGVRVQPWVPTEAAIPISRFSVSFVPLLTSPFKYFTHHVALMTRRSGFCLWTFVDPQTASLSQWPFGPTPGGMPAGGPLDDLDN